MNWRQINVSREIRLWIKEVIVPVGIWGATLLYLFPDLRHLTAKQARKFKDSIKDQFNKFKGEGA